MSKVYKGYELIKEIEEHNIKTGTKFKIKDFDKDVIYDGGDSLKFFDDSMGLGDIDVCYIINTEFEQIEEDTIDSIEELTPYSDDGLDLYTIEDLHKSFRKINEIIRKVNQIDKKIKELKDEEND